MMNYELARLAQADREREIAQRLRTTTLRSDRAPARRAAPGVRER
jgi:hypothetical protein